VNVASLESDEDDRDDLPEGAEDVLEFAAKYPAHFERISLRVAELAKRSVWHRKSAEYRGLLTERFASIVSQRDYGYGDFVEWIPGLRNRTIPAYGEPAVVISIDEQAFEDSTRDVNSGYFKEPIDLALGVLDQQDELVVFHFDSRRFRKFVEPAEPSD
jgi:hypothetical protein